MLLIASGPIALPEHVNLTGYGGGLTGWIIDGAAAPDGAGVGAGVGIGVGGLEYVFGKLHVLGNVAIATAMVPPGGLALHDAAVAE
jgi:hypothetical protein